MDIMQREPQRHPLDDRYEADWGTMKPGVISTFCHACAKAIVAANPPLAGLTYAALLE